MLVNDLLQPMRTQKSILQPHIIWHTQHNKYKLAVRATLPSMKLLEELLYWHPVTFPRTVISPEVQVQ